jgi:nitroimidazol reductase NimA-like FMN-containing flavoprotein (pyridoxamine 5'-phosphate oxidase superfamily)/ribosomal protein S18 acetylase RimI-like enzyme
MAFGREGNVVYLHGAVRNAMLAAIVETGRACLSFTLLDGLVFAKSAMHHSMNYRAVVAFGRTERVTDAEAKRRALSLLVEHIAPGRSAETREPNDVELRTTEVVAVHIEEASLKSRSGPAVDDALDESLPHYAGVVPLALAAQSPTRNGVDVSHAVRVRAEALGAPRVVEERFGEYLLSSDAQLIDVNYVHRFLRDESYWVPGIDLPRVDRALANSLCVGLYHRGRQVGFGRALTDGSRLAYLADIFVEAQLRGQGLGKALVAFLLRHPQLAEVERVLLGTRDAHELYRKFGFEEVPSGKLMGLSRVV